MSFATSQPLFDRFIAIAGIASAVRAHFLSNVPNQQIARFRTVSQALNTSGIRVHPIRLARIMRRMNVITRDLAN